jgi:DNA invertase Pin-like site-specific DNA recombinase
MARFANFAQQTGSHTLLAVLTDDQRFEGCRLGLSLSKKGVEINMRCATCARYSSDMQKPESIDDQIRKCRRCAEKRQWQVSEEHTYTDYAATGTDIGREGYNKLKDAALQHTFDFIMVDDPSRLGRNTAESIRTFSELTFYGVHITSVAVRLRDRRDQDGR